MVVAVVVDDNLESLQDTMDLISQTNAFDRVYGYSDPVEAYGCLCRNGCDVLFTETDMKGLHGITLANKLKKLLPDLFVVFVTNCSQYAIEAFENGALDYMVKPLTSGRLRQTVDKLKIHGGLCRDGP